MRLPDSPAGGGGAPSGAAGGDLSGTYPNPDVDVARGLREAGGTELAMATVADNEVLVRSGSSVDGLAKTTLTRATVLSAGTASIANGVTATLATLTRTAGRKIRLQGWIQENTAGKMLAYGAGNHGALDGISLWIERTANAQEFNLKGVCAGGVTLNVDWIVEEIADS